MSLIFGVFKPPNENAGMIDASKEKKTEIELDTQARLNYLQRKFSCFEIHQCAKCVK